MGIGSAAGRKPEKPSLKATAWLLLFCFFSAETSWATGLPGSPETGAEFSIDGLSSFHSGKTGLAALGAIEIPESIGKIKSIFQGTQDKIFIHIQDAHISESAQRNIAKILEIFSDRYGLKKVHVEGAEGTVYPQFLSFFPDRSVRKAVSDFLLREGRLSGPEYLAVVEQKNIQLEGIEKGELYQANREAYLEAAQISESDLRLLDAVGKILQNLPRFIFSEELLMLHQNRSRFQAGGGDLIPYVKALIQTAEKKAVPLQDYRQLDSFLKLIALEREIDFESASEQIEQMTQELKQIVSRQRLSQFLTNTVQFRMNKMRRSEYYGYLRHEIELVDSGNPQSQNRVPLKTQFDSVLKYLEYMQLYDQIGVTLFDEMERLEKEVKEKTFRNQAERDLDQLLTIHEIYRRIFSFELTKQDAEYFYSHKHEFKAEIFQNRMKPFLNQFHFSDALPAGLEALDLDLPRVERFYELALARDKVLIENTLRSAEQDSQNVSAIVTGGFHTPGIERYLREHGYSYLVLTPSLSGDLNSGDEKEIYERAMAGKPIALEEALRPDFEQAKSTRIQDPRFQLAAPSSLPAGRAELRDFMAGMLGREMTPQVQKVMEKSAPILLAMRLGEFLTAISSQGAEAAEQKILKEIAKHTEWPEEVRAALRDWTLSRPAYIPEPAKGIHRLYFKVKGLQGTQYFMLFVGPEKSAHEFMSAVGARKTLPRMRAPLELDGKKMIVWASQVEPDSENRGLLKGTAIELSSRSPVMREIPEAALPARQRVVAKEPVTRQREPAPRAIKSTKITVPPSRPEEPVPIPIKGLPPTKEKQRAEVRQTAPALPIAIPGRSNAFTGRAVSSLVLEALRRGSSFAETQGLPQLSEPLSLLLTGKADLHHLGEQYVAKEMQRAGRFKSLASQAMTQAGRIVVRITQQTAAPAIHFGFQILKQNSSGVQGFMNEIRSMPLSLETFGEVDRRVSGALSNFIQQINARVKSKMTGENFVAVDRALLPVNRAPVTQQKIIAGIESSQDFKQTFELEKILRRMALSNQTSPYYDENITEVVTEIFQQAGVMAYPKDIPGVLVYEWNGSRGYRAQMQLLRDLIYSLNAQRSRILIVLPDGLEEQRIAAWLDGDLVPEFGSERCQVVQGLMTQVVAGVMEANKQLEILQITGFDKILKTAELQRIKGLPGLSAGLVAQVHSRILAISDAQLAQLGVSRTEVQIVNLPDLFRQWAEAQAAGISA